nr:arsenic resistance protein [Leucobacter weissii]
MRERAERLQVPLYLLALAFGALLGLVLPGVARAAEAAVTPILALLLYATFLGVPFARIGRAFRDVRFLATVLVVNFLVVPAVVWLLSRPISHDRALLIAVLFVLLTPCIDYVIAFTGLAGGARDRLLAAAPLLMLVQVAGLPLYLRLFAGAEFAAAVDLAPFAEAFLLLILLPFAAAWATQFAAARRRSARVLSEIVAGAMVPLMMLTLAVVVASQVGGLSGALGHLLPLLPLYVLFAVVMVPIGAFAGRLAGLDVPGRRAVVFSGATRNSLVVLPLVLALPDGFESAPLAVVLQTFVELIAMVVFVRVIPRVIPAPRAPSVSH